MKQDRKELTEWKKQINSKSSYFEKGKLTLQKSDYNPNLLNSDLIIINDFNSKIEALKRQNKRWQKDLIDFEERTDRQIWTNLKQIQYFN